MAGWQSGSCRGLQILVHRFNSGTGLQNSFLPHILFRLSSAVEQSAVNRLVACSNQAAGAIKKTPSRRWCFFYGSGYLDERRPTGACLERIVDSNEPAKFESYGARRPRLREYPIWQLLAVLLNGRSLFPFRRFPCKKNAGYNIRQIKAL